MVTLDLSTTTTPDVGSVIETRRDVFVSENIFKICLNSKICHSALMKISWIVKGMYLS